MTFIDPDAVGIHQVLVAASIGDAITNMAFSTRRLLREVGPSEVYAHHIAPELANEVRPLSSYRSRHTRNILVFHASIGQREVHEFLSNQCEAIVLVYHNVTPSEYFEPYDATFAEFLALGRREVERLRPRVVQAIADSRYNARELEAMGYRDVRVVPPIMQVDRLQRVEPRASTLAHLRTFASPILLSVAQLMPHKRPDFLVEMMHCGETYGMMRPTLLIVGHHRLPRYTQAIRQQVRELMVDAHVVGPVDDADLVAMFQCATAVVSASEHEGFCMPLLEAMTFGTPIVARGCAAVPETVGDAGVLVPEHQGPLFFAEAVGDLLTNEPLQQHLVARGNARVKELHELRPDRAMLDALLAVV